MRYGPRGENSWMAEWDELPACVADVGVAQAMVDGGEKASGGLGLLRISHPQQMKFEGVAVDGLLRMRNVDVGLMDPGCV